MNDRIEPTGEHAVECSGFEQAAGVKERCRRQSRAVAAAQVVEDLDFEPGGEQLGRRDTPDVSGTAGDQHPHHFPFLTPPAARLYQAAR